jgi:type II restriction enzyme
VVVQFCSQFGARPAQSLLVNALKCAEELNPTKDSVAYWTCLNRAMLRFHAAIPPLWKIEKVAVLEALIVVKNEALAFLAKERQQIMQMSREDAITSLIRDKNIVGRELVIRSLKENGILSME